MTNVPLNIINSTLEIKASGIDTALSDLNLPTGKSIAELLYDQKEELPPEKEPTQTPPRRY